MLSTLKTYDETPTFLRQTAKEMSPTMLANSIIGMIGDMDAPMAPDQKGFTSMDRWLSGNTDEMRQECLALLVHMYLRTSTKVQILTPEEMRQERREQVLSTTAKDFAAFGEKLEIVSKSGTIAIVGSANAFEPDDVKALGLETKKLL